MACLPLHTSNGVLMSLQVGGFGMHTVGRTYQLAGDPVYIEVKLGPVGSRHKPSNALELHALACALLELLDALHAQGLVHRDIRRDNIVYYQGQWVLIDWELAGPADELLPFAIKRVPPDVAARTRAYTTQDDLWQVGLGATVVAVFCMHAQMCAAYARMLAPAADSALFKCSRKVPQQPTPYVHAGGAAAS